MESIPSGLPTSARPFRGLGDGGRDRSGLRVRCRFPDLHYSRLRHGFHWSAAFMVMYQNLSRKRARSRDVLCFMLVAAQRSVSGILVVVQCRVADV